MKYTFSIMSQRTEYTFTETVDTTKELKRPALEAIAQGFAVGTALPIVWVDGGGHDSLNVHHWATTNKGAQA